jgi:hypothetical protein
MGNNCCGCCPQGNDEFPRKEGRAESRTLTDKPCWVLFWVFVAGMVGTILLGLEQGNPKRLTHGADWEGQICGFDEAVKENKFMMFCGSPERSGAYPKFILEGSTVCVNTCPVDNSVIIDCLMPAIHNFTSEKGGMYGQIPNVETLQMDLTQSVTQQMAYPTEPFGGRFCLPSKQNPALRDLIINGPWGQFYRPMVSVGGLMDAWPLMLMAGVLALILGFLYVRLLGSYAGVIIFITMIGSVLLLLGLGLFFFFAVLMDMDDTGSTYGKFNPIMSVYVGDEAKIYSIITGVVMIFLSIILGALTCTSMAHIDEMIGLIEASCRCLDKSFPLKMFPLVAAAIFCAVMVPFFVFYGLPYVASMGALDYSEISINGQGLHGLQRVWKKNVYQHAMFWYYLVGMIFLFEFYLQLMLFIVAYCVCSWYFSGGSWKKKSLNNPMLEKALPNAKHVSVRVAGADPNYGPRDGRVVESQGQKYLVVGVQKKGPGVDRHIMDTEEFVKKPMGLFTPVQGVINAFMFHSGSLALGAPVIFFFRPFRMFSQIVAGFLYRTTDQNKGGGPGYSPDPHMAAIKGCLSLMSACLEQAFGKYSKIAWSELVLNGQDGFFDCSESAFNFLVKSGGAIAHLHGAMLLYEIFGCFAITMVCTWGSMIVVDKVDMFNEPDSSHYIEDKSAAIISCCLVSFVVAFSWMCMWNQIADVLLYCVAWNRRQVFLGEEHGMEESQMLEEPRNYAPMELQHLLPHHEMDPHTEHGLHAHGIGQQGAILAAMEHGAMNGGSGAPDYGQSIAQAHAMATRTVYG